LSKHDANIAGGKGGLERSIDPTLTAPSFATINNGLDNGITLKKLWIQGNNLWTIDFANSRLLVYSDSLVSPVNLTSPANGASGLEVRNVTLSWESLSGASGYHWQVDTDDQFSSIPDGLEGDTDSLFTQLPTLDPDITYYWRVRASQPIAGPWSDIRSFNTIILPDLEVPSLSEPRSSSPSPIDPIFKWTACDGAEKYELLVSRNDTFSNLVIDKTGDNACNANVWQCNISLNYNTGYYWKVRAVSGENRSAWSDVGIFITQVEPTPTPTHSSTSPSGGSGGSSTKTPTPTPTPIIITALRRQPLVVLKRM
jgi:hypothetical protein